MCQNVTDRQIYDWRVKWDRCICISQHIQCDRLMTDVSNENVNDVSNETVYMYFTTYIMWRIYEWRVKWDRCICICTDVYVFHNRPRSEACICWKRHFFEFNSHLLLAHYNCFLNLNVEKGARICEHDKIVQWDRRMRQNATDVQLTCQVRLMHIKTNLCKRPTYVARDLHLYQHHKTHPARHFHL